MHTIHIGYSENLDGDSLREMFDLDPEHPDGLSKISQILGSGYIEPGSYEVYGINDFPGYSFNKEFIQRLFPFIIKKSDLDGIPFEQVKSIFYMEQEELKKKHVDSISIATSIEVENFDYE